jgi:hypothetical protein
MIKHQTTSFIHGVQSNNVYKNKLEKSYEKIE